MSLKKNYGRVVSRTCQKVSKAYIKVLNLNGLARLRAREARHPATPARTIRPPTPRTRARRAASLPLPPSTARLPSCAALAAQASCGVGHVYRVLRMIYITVHAVSRYARLMRSR